MTTIELLHDLKKERKKKEKANFFSCLAAPKRARRSQEPEILSEKSASLYYSSYIYLGR